MSEIAIRRGTLNDLPHILHHRREMFREMSHTDAAVLDQVDTSSAEYFQPALRDGGYLAWLAEANGAVVGGGGLLIVRWPGNPDFPESRRGWILNIYTDPAFRRQGIARRIIEEILTWCRHEGFYHVSLHASKEGRLVYESIGFRPTNEMRLYLSTYP